MRLFIVSNRLPITAVEKADNLEFKESVGGVVTTLTTYLNSLRRSSFNKNEKI